LHQGPWSASEIRLDVEDGIGNGEIVGQSGILFDPSWLQKTREELLDVLRELHRHEPFLQGLNRAEWANRTGVALEAASGVVDWMLASQVVAQTGDAFHLPDHSAALPAAWQRDADSLWGTLTSAGLQPPLRDELEILSPNGKSIVSFWVATGKVIALGDGIVLTMDAFHSARQRVIESLSGGKSLAAGQLREILGTTRKYAVPILERLDRDGITRRVGDERVLCDVKGGDSGAAKA
jgi:selenocysteine-specific elongation factor